MSISNGNTDGNNGAGIYQEGASPGRVSGEQQPQRGCQQNTPIRLSAHQIWKLERSKGILKQCKDSRRERKGGVV